jgi:hypothetical protein
MPPAIKDGYFTCVISISIIATVSTSNMYVARNGATEAARTTSTSSEPAVPLRLKKLIQANLKRGQRHVTIVGMYAATGPVSNSGSWYHLFSYI